MQRTSDLQRRSNNRKKIKRLMRRLSIPKLQPRAESNHHLKRRKMSQQSNHRESQSRRRNNRSRRKKPRKRGKRRKLKKLRSRGLLPLNAILIEMESWSAWEAE